MRSHPDTWLTFQQRCWAPVDISRVAILLDVDGTILDVASTPRSVVVPRSLVRTLGELHTGTNGALALVSGLVLGMIEGLTKVIYPEASNIVVFIIMALVLIWRPAGLFGRE